MEVSTIFEKELKEFRKNSGYTIVINRIMNDTFQQHGGNMNNRAVKTVLACIIFVLVTTSSFADMSVPERLKNQQTKIDQGIASGQLSYGTADVVQSNLEWIKGQFYKLRQEGMLTPDKIAWLNSLLDENGGMIWGQQEPRIFGKPTIRQRIENQQTRIDQGIAAGRLSRSEAAVVQDNLNWIRRKFARMKAESSLAPGEIDKLNQMLDRNGAMIFKEKRDAIRRIY